jgi:NAD(P)-dependent dehydrogenase (short-subunit alcohol dehydrogenase family)
MKIILIGPNSAIGQKIGLLLGRTHEIISAGRKSGAVTVDISSEESTEEMFKKVTDVDACICLAGDSYTGNLSSMTTEQLTSGITSKVIGQFNLVRIGQCYLKDNGSFTLISGKMGDKPAIGSTAKAVANGAINSFTKAASLELPRGIRINTISPAKVSDIAVADLLSAYLKCIEGTGSGEIIKIGY